MNNKAFIIIGLILCLLFTIPMVSAAEVSADSDLIDNSVIGSNINSQAIATSDANGLESNIDDINSNIDSNINAHDNANNGDIIEGLNDNNTEIDIGSNNDDDNDKITDINLGNKNSNDKNILGANALTAVGDGNTFTDLEYLINKAISEGATSFTLPRDFTFTSGGDDSLINGITINSPITIIGGSHTIDGSNLARIFVINSNNVYLNGITFKNANASSEASFGANGGAVYVQAEGTITNHGGISNSTFINCYSLKDGGALYVRGDYFTLDNSSFINNTAGDDGGAIDWAGDYGRIYNLTAINNSAISYGDSSSKGGTLIVTGSNIAMDRINVTGSRAKGESEGHDEIQGGAIFLTGNNCNITNSTFVNCSVEFDGDYASGGALYILGNNTNVVKCNFTDNSATEDGGAIFIDGENCTLNHTVFINNTAHNDGGAIEWNGDNGRIYNLTAIDNCADSEHGSSKGGTLLITGDNAVIDKANISGSKVSGEHYTGDKALQGGAISLSGNNCNITNSVFTNCSVDFDGDDASGGALYIWGNFTNIINCNFTNNSATEDCGAIFIEGHDCSLNNTVFLNNIAHNDGGAIEWNGNNGKIYNMTADNNSADSAHGSSKGGTLVVTGSNMIMDGLKITNSYVDGDSSARNVQGGAIFLTGNNTNITNSVFEDCHIDYSGENASGGALYILGNNSKVENCNFTGNVAHKDGGAIYVSGSDVAVIDSNFIENFASESGGAIFLIDNKNSQINGSTFKTNVALLNGGAINFYAGAEDGLVSSCEFIDNSVWGAGGSVYWEGTRGIVEYSNFTGSRALGAVSDPNTGRGGSVIWLGDRGTIRECVFNDSQSTKEGSALYILGENDNVYYSNFTHCSSNTSGTVYIRGGYATIGNCYMNNNTVKENGGGIYVLGNFINLYDTSINNSKANKNGSGLYILGNRTQVSNTNLTNSDAASYGGFYIAGFRTVIDGARLENNTATNGSGIYVSGDQTEIKRTFFINNTANQSGGGLFYEGRGITLSDSVFDKNTAKTQKGGSIYFNGKQGDSILRCNFTNGWANTNAGGIAWTANGVGGLIKDCYFENMSSGQHGACIHWEKNQNGTIDNCTFVNSIARTTKNGGAVYMGTNPSSNFAVNPVISNCLIINCTQGNRGAINLLGINLTVVNNTFINITGVGGDTDGFRALEIENGLGALILNNTFINCSGNRQGSGVRVLAGENITVANNTFIDCHSTNAGGGIYSGAKGFQIFENNTFINNSGQKDGGAAAFANLVTSFKNNIFINNSIVVQSSSGGAVAVVANTVIDNSTFINNTALNNGGAVYSSGALTVNNSYFENNHADNNGGAIRVYSGNLRISNSSFFNNTAKVGGAVSRVGNVYVNGSSVFMYNKAETGSAISASNVYLTDVSLLQNQALFNQWSNQRDSRIGNHASINATFVGNDNLLNAINTTSAILSNVTYCGVDGGGLYEETTTNTNSVTAAKSTNEIHQIIILEIYDTENNLVDTLTTFTDANGKFNFEVDLANDANEYAYQIIHPEDNYYTGAEYTIGRALSELIIIPQNITHPEDENISFEVTGVAGQNPIGNITVFINDTFGNIIYNDTIFINESSQAILTLPRLNATEYYIYAKYNGDEIYLPDNETSIFHVNMAESFIVIEVQNYTYNETGNITITVPYIESGRISVIVRNDEGYTQSYTVYVDEGTEEIKIELPILDAGNYTVDALFYGNNNYFPSDNTTNFTVFKAASIIDVSANNVSGGERSIVDIHVDPEVATQNVNVTVTDANGNVVAEYEDLGLLDSKTSITLPVLPKGRYNVTVHYGGDKNHNESDNDTIFYVTNDLFPIDIEAIDLTYGENETINITVPKDANSEKLWVEVKWIENDESVIGNNTIANLGYSIDENGIVHIDTSTLETFFNVGNYSINVYYEGDDDFLSNSSIFGFEVFKADVEMMVIPQNISYGEIENITVEIPKLNEIGQNDALDLYVNSTNNESIRIFIEDYDIGTDGKAIWNLDNVILPAGEYIVEAVYAGSNNYKPTNRTERFTVSKVATWIEIEVNNIFVGEDEVINVTVHPNGEGGVTCNITLYVRDKEVTLQLNENGQASYTLADEVESTDISVIAIYNGDNNFNESKNSTTYNVTKQNTTTTVDALSPIKYGTLEDLNITVNFTDATGTITLYINSTADGFNNITKVFTLAETDEGKVNWDINGLVLPVGTYDVTAVYSGNDKYNNSTSQITLIVVEQNEEYEITVEANDTLYGDDEIIIVTVPEDAEGTVTISIDGNEIETKEVSGGKAIFNITGLEVHNDYNVTAIYNGDSNYKAGNTGDDLFNVTKAPSHIEVIAEDIDYRQTENITVSLADVNASGKIVISIINKTSGETIKTQDIDEFVTTEGIVYSFEGLEAGNYTVKVEFTDDHNYENSEDAYDFEVRKSVPEISEDSPDITYGNDETITVTVPTDASGTIDVLVDGVSIGVKTIGTDDLTFTISKPLADSKHNITLIYSGDSNYDPVTIIGEFAVDKLVPSIEIEVNNIFVGDDEVINITVIGLDGLEIPTGNLSILVKSLNETKVLNGGQASLSLENEVEGTDISVVVFYNGDSNYNATMASAAYNVTKKNTTTIVTGQTPITYGSIENLTITINETDVTGTLTLYVYDDFGDVNIIKVFEIGDSNVIEWNIDGEIFDVYSYNVTAVYSGDDKHIGSTGTFQFAVEPFGDFELSISAPGGEYLNVADVVVTVSPAIPGWIHLIINDSMIVYDSKMLQYGRVRFNVSNFEVGTYNITADYFYGVDYVSKDISIVFEVTKIDSHIKAIPEDIDYTQVENINVSLPDYNASGKLIITITNKSDSTQIIRTLEIDEFNATEGIVYSFEGLLPGNYTVKAEYINDHNYKDSEYTADFEVRKGDPTLTENSPDITYGEDENITVSITGVEGGLSPTGTIEVIVDGVIVDTITIGDDLEYIVIKPLADPKHNVTVVYSGDSNYNPLTITGEFEVTKASNEITVVPTNISYGQIENITVTVPDGATGTVSITVGTYTDTKEITDGISEIIFNIPKETGDDLLNANENYIVFANYSGDSNYESVVANAPFHVDPANTTVNIEANNIPYGNDEILNITVTGIEGAAIPAGFVTITINGTDIELTKRLDSEGKASFNISGLVVGEYNVTAKYESSTQNYNDSNSNALFNVTKADVKEENRNISAINITYGDDETITVVLNETNITGNVTITIGDYTDTKPLDNGKAVFTIAHLEANDYTVVANYSGDSNYNPISIEDGLTTGFKVDKANVTVEVDPIDIIYKETEKINVTVTGVLIDGEASDVVAKYNLSGKVTIYIDGVENQTKDISEIDENGILHFDVEGLAVGKHNVTAVYHDDRNYNDNSDAKDFNVDNALPENMQVNVQNITYHIESENIEIDLGEVLNGNLVVYLNNTEIYNAEVIDKDKITLSPIENLEVANYTVRAVFTANDDSVDANATFEVKQAPTVVSVEPINITYGEIENITVFVDNTIADKFNLTGSVTIYINGREVETKAIGSDGKAVFNVEGLSAADDYLVEARYHSDRNYLNSTGNSGFNVTKADVADFNETSDNNITAVNITYGEDETITLEFSENNITGKVTITINGEEIETKDLENGKVSFTVKDLEVNDYAVVANYSGDSNYNPKEGITTSFTVSKANSTVTVVPAPTVVYGNNETITVTVPIRNHTGTITLTINGTDYEFIKHLTAEDGDTIVLTNVSGLAVGTYNVTVKYTDDRNYNDSEASALFEVIKAAPSQITVEAQNITYTEDEIIVVTVGDANATGSVSITIGDYTDTVELDENGQAKFNVTGLVVGHYTVEANYSGDANYTSQSASAPFRVDKVASNVTVDAEDIIYGEIEYANITIPNYNATGRVIIKVDGKLYDVLPIDSNTPVKLELEGLDVGTHTIDVEYFDDVNYNNSIAHIEFNVTKATIPVDPENESSLIVVPSNITYLDIETIVVSVGVNNATGRVTITLKDKDGNVVVLDDSVVVSKNITEEGSQSVTFTVPGLAVGDYTVEVKYDSDANYEDAETSAPFLVNPANSTVTVEPVNITYLDDETITVTVPIANASGTVVVKLNGTVVDERTVSGDNPSYAISIEGLAVGEYNVTVEYSNDPNYNDSEASALFHVDNANIPDVPDTEGLVVIPTNITYLDDENITVTLDVPNATGKVTIKINGTDVELSKNITEEGSQTVTFTVPGLSVGDYNVTVEYTDDANYNDCDASALFTVSPAESNLTVVPTNITYLDDETIVVTAPIENATGKVTITINGTDIELTEAVDGDGKVTFTVPGLVVGEYNVTAKYHDDPNYNDSEASALFHVDKANIPDVPDTEGLVVIPTNITYLDDETITVTLDVPNATGKVTIKINGTDVELSKNITEEGSQTVTFTVPGLVVGDYNVTVEYTDDANYNDYDASAIFTVSPAASSVDEVPVDITYGDDETITVTVPVENATGKVTISINGTDIELSKNITEEGSNTVTFTVPGLVVGDYNVTAKYSDDANYNDSENSALFTVSKANVTDMTVVPTNITYLDDETIVVTVDANNATGKVTITINGTDVELTEAVDGDGKATFTVPGLVVGEYNVTAKYGDDPNYNDSEASALFHVDKANITDINVTPTNITYGDNETITVSIGDNNATGSITIKVNGTEYGPQELKDGSTTFNVPGLLAGDYEVEVSYSGDDNYNATSANAEFTVDKAKPTVYAIGTNITYGDDEQITAIVDGKNVTGTVTVFIDGEEVGTVELTQIETGGRAVLNVPGLSAGNHTVKVIYNGDDNHNVSEAEDNFTVSQDKPSMDINVTDIDYHDTENIEIALPEDATGTVNVTVTGDNGITKTFNDVPVGEDGTVRIPVEDLPAGNYNVTVSYSGDENYTAVNGTAKFSVDKIDSTVDVDTEDITYGENETIRYTVPEDATGTVNITVVGDNGVTKVFTDVSVENGTVGVNVEGLPAGNYNVAVQYSGDDNYNPGTGTSDFTVDKAVPEMDIETEDIDYNQTENITVTLPEDATGTVNVTVTDKDGNNGTFTDVPIGEDGTVIIPVEDLPAGDYDVTVDYSGDDNYSPTTGSGSFTVDKIDSILDVDTEDISYGDDETIEITLPEDATGTVNVTVTGDNGVSETFIDVPVGEDGTVSIPLENLPAGNYEVNVAYSGDNNYNAENASSTFNVDKAKPNAYAVGTNITYGDDEQITAIVDGKNVTGTVTVFIDGEEVGTVELTQTDTGGRAVLNVPGLSAGNHTVKGVYSGDDNHIGSEAEDNFTVSKAKPAMEINTSNIDYGETEKIEIGITGVEGGVTPTGTVNVTVVGDNGVTKTFNDVPVGEDGTVSIPIEDLPVGTYDVTVKYSGDENYTDAEGTSQFSVGKIVPDVDVDTADIDYHDTETINVTLPEDATGTVNVTVVGDNGVSKTFNDVPVGEDGTVSIPVDDLPAGNYDVTVKYSGDKNYAPATGTGSFTVNKIDPTVDVDARDIDYHDTETIEVTVPDDATGTVNITVTDNDGNNRTFTDVPINEGKASVDVNDLPAGDYDVTVDYSGDDNYDPATGTSSFTVGKIDTPVELETQNVTYGDDETITVSVPEDATGNVTITVKDKDGNVVKNVTVPISDGTAELVISDLDADNYTVHVDYSGDNNYMPNSTDGKFEVAKANATVEIHVYDIIYGDIEELTVTCNAPGTVTIYVNGEEVTLPLENGYAHIVFASGLNAYSGNAQWDLENLAVGTYPASVHYNGDKNHNEADDDDVFHVIPANTTTNVSVEDIKVGEDAVIDVEVTHDRGTEKINANITVTVDGKEYTVELIDGKGKLIVPGLKAGEHTVEAVYPGSHNYTNSSDSTTFNVIKHNSSTKVTPKDIKVGDDEKITVTVPKDATGTVTIDVGGKKYTAPVKDGKAVFTVPGLKAGNYTVKAKYSGDDKYLPSESTGKFTVSKVKPDVNVIAPTIKEGQDGKVTVTVPKDATGNVTVEIDGKKYTAPVKDGKAVFTIPGLKAGKHHIKVHYSGDDKYESADVDGGDLDVIGENQTSPSKQKAHANGNGIDLESKATGNPIAILLMVFALLGFIPLKRKYDEDEDEDDS